MIQFIILWHLVACILYYESNTTMNCTKMQIYWWEEDWHLKRKCFKTKQKTLVQGKQNYEGWVLSFFWKRFGQKSWYLKTHHLAWLVPYHNHRLVKNTAAVLMFNLGHNHWLHWG